MKKTQAQIFPSNFKIKGQLRLVNLIAKVDAYLGKATPVSGGSAQNYYFLNEGGELDYTSASTTRLPDKTEWTIQDLEDFVLHEIGLSEKPKSQGVSSVTTSSEPVIIPVTSTNIIIGAEVKRGKDWRWEDQDGGAGNIGILVRVPEENWVNVMWVDSGRSDNYRTDHEDLVYAGEGTLQGYEVPFDLFEGLYKAGELLTLNGNSYSNGEKTPIPSEIVTSWTPRYNVATEPSKNYKLFEIGQKGRFQTVLVSKEKVLADGNEVDVEALRNVIRPKLLTIPWRFEITSATYRFGCTSDVTQEQLLDILTFYDKLNAPIPLIRPIEFFVGSGTF